MEDEEEGEEGPEIVRNSPTSSIMSIAPIYSIQPSFLKSPKISQYTHNVN